MIEHEASGAIGLAAFWARRARRLLPAALARGEVCPDTVDGRVPRPDGNHFSVAGGAWIVPALLARAEAKGVHFAAE